MIIGLHGHQTDASRLRGLVQPSTLGSAGPNQTETLPPTLSLILSLTLTLLLTHLYRLLSAQRVLDKRLNALLADAPRRSVLMIDSGKAAADGGCVLLCHPLVLSITSHD